MTTPAPPLWHALRADDALARLDASAGGLAAAEVRARLARHGPNRIEVTPPTPAWRILGRQLASVVIALLVVGAVLALAVGDVVDAAAIGVVLVLNVAIGFATELRAGRAMDALRALDVPRATVMRDGTVRDVDAAQLVPGDVILLEAGTAVPADARLLAATELRVVESALTGESLPVAKAWDAAVAADAALADRTTVVHKGTAVVAGSARALVVATGGATEVGRVGRLLASVEEERTPLERRLDALGRRLALVAVAVAALVAALHLAQGASLASVLETAIAVAIAAVPEGLPAVVTITMAVGVRRMARRNALVRRLPTVESLGAATVVCTDKTGTLTLGEMMVTALWLPFDRALAASGTGYAPEGALLRDGA